MNSKLKPCPYCGYDEAWIRERFIGLGKNMDYDYKVNCKNCGNGTTWLRSKKDAISRWNRRTKHSEH